MNLTDEPAKIELPFADSGAKNTIPIPSQIGITPGAASFTDGFPPLTRTPKASGGIPPKGLDMNGILNTITAVQQWQSAGGLFAYDADFSDSIGGYPKGALLISDDGTTVWQNTADNNETDPDGGSPANWVALLTSADLSGYALLSGATFTGNTLVPNRADGDDSGHAANTAFVQSALGLLTGGVSFGATDGMPFKWTFGDLIIQANVFALTIVSTGTNTDQAVTFPDAFPTGCLGVVCYENDSTPRGLDNLFCTKPTTTGFTATGRDENETGASRIFYVAIGH